MRFDKENTTKYLFSRPNYFMMEDHFGFARTLLFLQKLYGFRIIDNSDKHKLIKILNFFHFFFFLSVFLFITHKTFYSLLEGLKESYLARIIVIIDFCLYNFTTLSFYFNYLRIKKYSSRVLLGLKKLDTKCLKYFGVKVDHKRSNNLIKIALILPGASVLTSFIRVLCNLDQLKDSMLVLVISHFFYFFFILQLYFYAFFFIFILTRLKRLNLEVQKSFRQKELTTVKVDILVGFFDEIILIMKNIKKGFSANILPVLCE